jgi:RNA polymerase sigma-70 factor (sigma-E family)
VGNDQGVGGGLELDASFDAFVSRGSATLLRSAYLLTGDRGHAEDLLQASLIATARRWESARYAPAAYAHRVLINMLHDRRRRLARQVPEQPLDESRDADGAGPDETHAVLDRDALIGAVKLLPRRQREVLVLRFFADLSVSETAAAIGTSDGSVETHTSRALAKLREVLADESDPLHDETTEVPRAH